MKSEFHSFAFRLPPSAFILSFTICRASASQPARCSGVLMMIDVKLRR